MNKIEKSKGFTIIEVVLVLAIAGLIFLMVFIALPGLQKSQRDTQRKSDLSRIMTQVVAYSNNNRGAVPADLVNSGFVKKYLGGTDSTDDDGNVIKATKSSNEYQDPKLGTGYTFVIYPEVADSVGEVGYRRGKVCGTDGVMSGTGTARNFALTIYLETMATPFCMDNR